MASFFLQEVIKHESNKNTLDHFIFWKIFHSVNSLFSIFNPSFSLIYHPCVEIYAYSSVCVSFLLYSVYYVSDSVYVNVYNSL